jgi:hypothetical protein
MLDPSTTFILETVRREVGEFGKISVNDPYKMPHSYDNLRQGWGTPEGFESRSFVVEIADAQDPRLTREGVKHLADKLRFAAGSWIEGKLKENSHKLIGCVTPNVSVSTAAKSPALDDRRLTLFILVKVYVYPRLTPDVKAAGDGEILS